MKEYKELYLPVFFNWFDMTEGLSDEEFGMVIRALISSELRGSAPDKLSPAARIAYAFMLDAAKRTHDGQKNLSQIRREAVNKRWDNERDNKIQNDTNSYKTIQSDTINENINENENINVNVNENEKGNRRSRAKGQIKEQYGDFDTDYAFRKAIERTYGTLNMNELDDD